MSRPESPATNVTIVATRRRGAWIAAIGTALAVLSCYGTLVVVTGLSALGLSLAVNEQAWAGAIAAFSMIAFLGVAVASWRAGPLWALLLAGAGFGAILWVMFVSYGRAVELAGFVGLVTGAIAAWRAQRQHRRA